MEKKFIAIEGPDGCGKTSVINRLKEYVSERNLQVRFTREPGGTRISEKIREILLDSSHSEMTKYTEAYLYAASRLQHTEEFILPSLASGFHVISDRYAMASIAYQGYGRDRSPEFIERINQPAVDFIGEVNYIVLMISPEEGIIRKKGQKILDRLEMEDLDFHQRVCEGYEKLIKRTGALRIDASKPLDEVVEDVLAALNHIGVQLSI